MNASERQVHILMVDDDDVDIRAMQRSFRKAGIDHPLAAARDGVEALEVLRGANGKDRLPRPCLILLDLNMPRMSGFEFLRELRRDPALSDSVVFVQTTSDADSDKAGAYRHNVSGYLIKEGSGGGFDRLAALLNQYLDSVEFPPARTGAQA